ncbi:MAG: hypothetical protein K2O00_08140 [Muribaculaceae bacterium]|nr:hypothetical protein [Muribaculaceae bacterium]
MKIVISDEIRQAAPAYMTLVMEADVLNIPSPDALWAEIEQFADEYRASTELSQVNKRPGIASTRAAYKALGKDPNRYRPSNESMGRRLVKGMELYCIDALVDLVNLLSLKSGYSIGGFDRDKISGDTLTLGVGREGEPYEGIGRGELNIAGLPVFRDAVGGVGTPTSDNERTKMDLDTRHIVITIHQFAEDMPLDRTEQLARRLLEDYASATNITSRIIKAS